ncbi:hypothetical protein J1781_21555 [Rahnella sp. C60]|uniref:MaoC/PaaZ C-terminal domain-containing protein n=1 Tax=Rahnella perminowiae TaxID=2816244 RepID=UPI001C25ACF3|nr:MaoC/PaaZ C-terminal domain-containing protein [Rahnella perminowiae]MBU9817416.1 hypothetical protein [Rahnella perminowiae]MCR8999211.1 MaoC/PaaZ C-terminal domain-containing protein [Rahnella perminowiae]UJD87353.1 hypothetical protein FS594_00270 [Rahnella aquatilis]
MMFSYDVRDAEAWAKFSGDYNPIHFDLQQARAMGLETLTVHGMRALLDMKNHLSHNVMAAKSEFYQFNARLRQAVKCQTPYQLVSTLILAGSGVSSLLTEPVSGTCCFSSKLTGKSAFPAACATLDHMLTGAQLAALSEAYPSDKPDVMSWELLDAVLFAQIVNMPETLECVRESIPHLSALSLADVFKQIPVVQTHHDVHFSRQHMVSRHQEAFNKPFYYGLLPAMVIGDSEQGFVIRMTIQGGYDAHPSIMTAITLKTWPVQTH